MAALLAGLVALSSDPSAEGMKALDEKRYDAAIESFTQAIAADPKDVAAHFYLALALSEAQRDDQAASQYRKTLELKPDLYEAELNLGILLLRDKQPAAAAPLLEKAALQKPKEFRPARYLGEALLMAGDAEDARKAFDAALQLDPKSAAPELGLARALMAEKQLDDAAQHFRKAVELDPANHNFLLALGQAYEDAGRAEDAIAIYKQFPDDPGAQEHIGRLELQSGAAADAIAHFQNALAKEPTNANRVALAEAYLKANQRDKALPLIDTALAATPDDYDLVMVKARILRDQRRFDAACQEFLAAARLRPTDWQPWSELAGLDVIREDYGGALFALDHVHALNADKPGHFFLRAIVLDKTHQVKPAIASYRHFLETSGGKNPDDEFKARQRVRILTDELNRR